jgi:hypothetical protein
MLPGMQKSVREWTSTLLSELPLWELAYRWTLEFYESDRRGQNPMDWSIFYIIWKLLICKCLKWARMTHLGNQNTSYGQKKGWESCPLKVGNLPNFLMCRWCAYYWKTLNEDHNVFSDLTSIGCFHTKLWASKVVSPNFENFETLTSESRDKMTFGCWPHGQAQSIL